MADPTYPGVYIEELPGGVRAITGAATSITAFIGRAQRGPVQRPVRVQSFAEYSRIFGGLWKHSTMSYAVDHFFQHGGADALIVRVFNGDTAASTPTITLPTATGSLVLEAAGPGLWGQALRATVDHLTQDTADPLLFNVTIEELDRPGGQQVVASESFSDVSVSASSTRRVDTILKEQSALVRVRALGPADESPMDSAGASNPYVNATGTVDDDGSEITDTQVVPSDPNARDDRIGIYALEWADLFNLLCIPPLDWDTDVSEGTWAVAAQYCQKRRAMLIVDPPLTWTANASSAIGDVKSGVNRLRGAIGNDNASNVMVHFPRLLVPDPLSENRLAAFAPCGAVAGIISRIDAHHGIWKAPAGMDASFSGVQGFTYKMTDAENGELNPIGLNCLRSFPPAGHLVWGARTLAGADLLASEWKYIPVRRLALFIEESLYRGIQWVVFEPNDEPLWARICLAVGAFMHTLFRQGAFQGTSPSEAYFVNCDGETTTQNDIDLGIVNILVGFAPLKPAEFVIIRIQQMAGQVEA